MKRSAAAALAVLLSLPCLAAPPTDGDPSVRDALAWLARRQGVDGSWSATGGPGHGFEALYEPDAASESSVLATSSALLAFLGAGNTPWAGSWRESALRAWQWLRSVQESRGGGALAGDPGDPGTGTLADRERRARRAHVARLNHLWGTLALLETAAAAESAGDGLSRAEARRLIEAALPPAEQAVAFVTRDADGNPPAFHFLDPRSVTMDELALLAAIAFDCEMLRVRADLDWFRGVPASMKDIQRGMTGPFVPRRASEDGEYWLGGTVSTPQCMAGFVWMLEGGSAKQLAAASPVLLVREPRWAPCGPVGAPARHPAPGGVPRAEAAANEYGWFWQGMAFRSYAALDAESWRAWRAAFEPMAAEHQRKSGEECGSWDPTGPHARVFGREASTAWIAVTLQSSCRLRMARTHWDRLARDPRAISMREVFGRGVSTRERCEVCGMEVDSLTMFSKGAGGKVYYFCSQAHLAVFEHGDGSLREGGGGGHSGGHGGGR